MPLTAFELAVGVAMLVSLAVGFVSLNRWRHRVGWWMLAAVVGLIVVGNALERIVTGNSALF